MSLKQMRNVGKYIVAVLVLVGLLLFMLSSSLPAKAKVATLVQPADAGTQIVQRAQWYGQQSNAYSQGASLRTGTQVNGVYYFDCSGFVYRVFEDVGQGGLINNSSNINVQQASGTAIAITDYNASPPSNLTAGDLVFFGAPLEHVGIVVAPSSTVGTTQFISPQESGLSIGTFPINVWSEQAVSFVLLNFSGGQSPTTGSNSSSVHSPVVARNADGRMEVFQVGSNGQLYHQWEDSNGNWSGWASLGGSWPGQVAVGLNSDGRLEAFLVGNQGPTGASLFHAWQTSAGSSSWTGWTALPGTWPAGTPAVTQNLNQGLEVFMRGQDSNLYHIWENNPGDSTSYLNWYPLGGYWHTDPVVVNNADNTMQVFMVGESTQLYYDQEDSSGNWSGWVSLGGTWSGQVAVTLNTNGELEAFMVGNQGPSGATLYHVWQSSPESSSWTMNSGGGWWALPGTWPTGTPAVTTNQNGQLDVFLVGSGTTLYHDYENADGSWSGPQSLGGDWPGIPFVTTNLASGLEVFLLGNSGEVYHAWENNAGDSSSYTGWYTLGVPQG